MCVMVNGHTLDERGGPEKGRREVSTKDWLTFRGRGVHNNSAFFSLESKSPRRSSDCLVKYSCESKPRLD